jgi:predicted MFS family arabinose efflux permease
MADRRRMFGSLKRHPYYRLYVAGNVISLPGNWLQSAAQAWMVLDATHSAAAVGSVTFWTFLPYAVFGIVAGPVVDRLDPRRVLIATQAALALAAGLLAVLAMSRHVVMLDMDLIAAFRGIALVLNNPARQVLLVRIVGRQDLRNAISLNSAVNNMGRIFGPVLSGVLIARTGISTCFWLNAASFLPFIAAVAVMRLAPRPAAARPDVTSVGRDLLDGFRYALRNRTLLLAASILLVAAVFSINFSVLLPVYTAQVLHAGPAVYGILYSLLGLGSLLGAVVASNVSTSRWSGILLSAMLFGAGEIVLGSFRDLGVAYAAAVLTGAGYTFYTTNTSAVMQLVSPDEMQGRTSALYSYIFTGSNPVTALLMGDLAQSSGAGVAFSVGGIALCATAGMACLLLCLREPGSLRAGIDPEGVRAGPEAATASVQTTDAGSGARDNGPRG